MCNKLKKKKKKNAEADISTDFIGDMGYWHQNYIPSFRMCNLHLFLFFRLIDENEGILEDRGLLNKLRYAIFWFALKKLLFV